MLAAKAIKQGRILNTGQVCNAPERVYVERSIFERFVTERLSDYAVGRDEPSKYTTSELSPHLRFGEISPFQIWERIEQVKQGADAELLKNCAKFMAEVGWREFSYHLLFHWPDLATVNFDARFNSFPWAQPEPEVLRAWQQGETGIPLVDAGMRELWQTGYMHNRVRMVAASFLIKNLLVDWRVGEAWFWDTLVDADDYYLNLATGQITLIPGGSSSIPSTGLDPGDVVTAFARRHDTFWSWFSCEPGERIARHVADQEGRVRLLRRIELGLDTQMHLQGAAGEPAAAASRGRATARRQRSRPAHPPSRGRSTSPTAQARR